VIRPVAGEVSRALALLEQLPRRAIGDVVQRLIDRLDEAEPDPDLEPEGDHCEAEGDSDIGQTRQLWAGARPRRRSLPSELR
jgi:hypothetical protein